MLAGKTLSEIAGLIEGTVTGNQGTLIFGVTNIEDAGPQDITFAVAPHLQKAEKSAAAAVIIPRGASFSRAKPAIAVDNPRAAFARVLELFTPAPLIERGVHPAAVIAGSAQIGANAAIMPLAVIDEEAEIGDGAVVYPHVYIGRGCRIGKDCLIYANVSVYAGCQIGDRVIIHSGAVIGGDGFGYVDIGREHRKVPQVGNVVLGDDVEIGCNACIDCGTTGSTLIGKGTKIDNLVHVGHNDVIGENCLLIAHVGISGSVRVGSNVTFAGQSATVGHIKIGDNCVFGGRAGIISDVPDNSVYAGFPAQPHKDWLRQEALQRKLPEFFRRLRELETQVKELGRKK
ncbi:MAG: UDP-3-O-(3-hydroxymyristoyl)glucosamine N-acyltransferase [Acidaminococcales bacterium]|jgi:UDP-3-O-[3-hydroxymyristoyl] glucosamine N-acyltransferase|nr:UDP-3-O-(3-hydroxymyristoyl)glucosamine N-acyltransferase [Acidaminococcales bacterium]